MAAGGWVAGVIYDHFGFYTPAFATGLGVNLINLAIISTLSRASIRPRRCERAPD